MRDVHESLAALRELAQAMRTADYDDAGLDVMARDISIGFRKVASAIELLVEEIERGRGDGHG